MKCQIKSKEEMVLFNDFTNVINSIYLKENNYILKWYFGENYLVLGKIYNIYFSSLKYAPYHMHSKLYIVMIFFFFISDMPNKKRKLYNMYKYMFHCSDITI